MASKLKAFAVWLLVPYLVAFIAIPGTLYVLGRNLAFATSRYWKGQPFGLAFCGALALFGTVVLWLLPIRRAWLGMVAGAAFALGGVALSAWLGFTYWGGFEANINIMVGSLLLLIPSGVAGAYAGLLRSREEASKS
jgi:hypothetical protein